MTASSLSSSVRDRLHARTGLLAVSAGALLWGTTGVAVAVIGDRTGLGAVPIGFLRLAIAAVALALWFRGAGVRRVRASLRRHRWVLLLSGAGLGGYQALYFVGVQYVGVSISTLVSLAIAPVAITAVTAVRGRQVPSASALATLACAIGGLALISLAPGAQTGPHPVAGILASLGSGLGYAATTLLNRRLAADGEPLLLTASTSAIGAVVLLPFALVAGLWWPHDAVASGWLVYIGVVSTVAAYGLFYAGLRSTSPEAAGVLTLLEPLAAALLAAAFLHEQLSGAALFGSVLLLVAIAGLYLRRPEPAPL